MPTSEINEILARLRDLFAAEYQRGEAAAIARMKAALDAPTSSPTKRRTERSSAQGKKARAKRGTPEAFVRRVLRHLAPLGVKAGDISDFADTPDETLVSSSSIRSVLVQGAADGWARNHAGMWYFTAENAEEERKLAPPVGSAAL
jgi:hypothetical protein